jgi:hypothetical protein
VPGSYLEDNWRYKEVERIGPELRVESSDLEISFQATTKEAYVEDFYFMCYSYNNLQCGIIICSYDML